MLLLSYDIYISFKDKIIISLKVKGSLIFGVVNSKFLKKMGEISKLGWSPPAAVQGPWLTPTIFPLPLFRSEILNLRVSGFCNCL